MQSKKAKKCKVIFESSRSQRYWQGLLIPMPLLPETPIEVILLRVLFTAKVLTNLRWQGAWRRGGGGGGIGQRRAECRRLRWRRRQQSGR